jgi:hypothetical protein
MIQVVGVFVSAGDREHSDAQDVGDAVGNKQRIAQISGQPDKFAGETYPALGGGQQHDTAGRGKPPVISMPRTISWGCFAHIDGALVGASLGTQDLRFGQ